MKTSAILIAPLLITASSATVFKSVIYAMGDADEAPHVFYELNDDYEENLATWGQTIIDPKANIITLVQTCPANIFPEPCEPCADEDEEHEHEKREETHEDHETEVESEEQHDDNEGECKEEEEEENKEEEEEEEEGHCGGGDDEEEHEEEKDEESHSCTCGDDDDAENENEKEDETEEEDHSEETELVIMRQGNVHQLVFPSASLLPQALKSALLGTPEVQSLSPTVVAALESVPDSAFGTLFA